MRSGFTFKGIHSSKFGITAKTRSRSVLPEMKYSSVESPLIDGVYDFSAANEYGHAFYNDRFFEIQIQAAAYNLRELEKKVSKIAVWLRGNGELRFDDMPLVKFKCSVISEMGFVPEWHGKTTVMTAVFRAEPFGECIFDTVSGPELNSEIPGISLAEDGVVTGAPTIGGASINKNVTVTDASGKTVKKRICFVIISQT